MSEFLTAIGIIVGVVLIAVIWIEAHEYRKYVKAANSLIALGEAMKVSFEQIGLQMGRFSVTQTALAMDAEEKDNRIAALEMIQAAHTDALTVRFMTEVAKQSKGVVKSDVTGF